ncbi:MAG: large conductance mechanosensitive channel protein MscL [Clostridiales bacterium]|nr:large conductance mechanosensitive channel protein MscL [Clostridiales bacterium]
MFKEFKEFAMQGNVIDMAVGVMIGGAFGKIVSSLVSDVFMPLIGLLTGGVNISGAFVALDGQQYASIEDAAAKGIGTLNYGIFLQAVIDFVIIAFFIFLFVKLISKAMPAKEAAPVVAPYLCPYCYTEIDPKATRCPHCTSELKAEKQ